MKTRLLSFLVAIAAAIVPAAAYDFMVGGLCYTISIFEGGGVWVVSQNTSSPRYTSLSGNVTIPSTVSYGGKTYDVKGISNYAFSGCKNITSVVIPNSIVEIGQDAFLNCSGLTSVILPSSVTTVGREAFKNCTSLAAASLSSSMEMIPVSLFNGCSNLTEIVIPNSVTTIGYSAFQNCTKLAKNVVFFRPMGHFAG